MSLKFNDGEEALPVSESLSGSANSFPETSPNLDQITAYAVTLGHERLHPSLRNSDYLVLIERHKKFIQWLRDVSGTELRVIDIGGRIQPYRALIEGRIKTYVAVDPRPTGLVDAVAVGEQLPFADSSFDLALCTQVLCYVTDPQRVVDEAYRVLVPGGTLLLSAPAFFPYHAESDLWRFSPNQLRSLFSRFSHVEVSPEGYSISGLCRLFSIFMDFFFETGTLRKLVISMLIPFANLAGAKLDGWSHGDTRFTNNYSVLATK